jgi:hypothetical protein
MNSASGHIVYVRCIMYKIKRVQYLCIHPQAFPTSSLLSGKLLINQSDKSAKRGGGYLERWQGSTGVTNRSAMCDFWDDDRFYTFGNRPPQAAARVGGTDRPSTVQCKSHLPGHYLPGQDVMLGQLFRFRPLWFYTPPPPSHHISSSKNGNFLPDSWNFSQEM